MSLTRPITRRSLIQSLAATAGLFSLAMVMPRSVLAWAESAFRASAEPDAMQALYGDLPIEESDQVTIRMADIAENGAVVPVTLISTVPGTESISLFVENNPLPLVAQFMILEGTDADISTRIRMEGTSKVTAVVKVGDRLYRNSRVVSVTVGGCGV